MSEACHRLIVDRIRQHGPLTFAEFMELALYDPQVGYYAGATRRSGRTGDFYTSVDVGPVFGEFLARQFAEMARLLTDEDVVRGPRSEVRGQTSDFGHRTPDYVDLVEAGAGDGRLSRDVLDALERSAPDVYERVHLHLVERSELARAAQRATLARHASKLASSSVALPSPVQGIIFANELLDALPAHAVMGRAEGLREIFIDAVGDRLVERELTPSTPALEQYFDAIGVRLAPGWRAEVNLTATDWMRQAAGALQRGFLVLVDYGHEARELFSASHASGTLATFAEHVVESRDETRQPPWLQDPGSRDVTAHVDFTSIRNAGVAAGLDAFCLVDQMHFLLGLGVEDWLLNHSGSGREDLLRRLALKTLLVPGGLGTTHHVMICGRNVQRPALKGCA